MTELLSIPGTYAIWMKADIKKKIRVGKLAAMQIHPGYYVYIGSAFGPGGIKSRVGRHMKKSKTHRWHIDYLRRHTTPVEVWLAYEQKLEHDWAEAINNLSVTTIPLPRFGASDCRCPAHLFFCEEVITPFEKVERLVID